ncbi:hypothetical protein BLNAU_13719 [Blattamonas nauphoetae]|uniref:MIF4G domain-containing protein n=1 Tax=Blattamonas nauphoetae TaxID=2049346 RepID=A0ABQ9XMH5_9EUKA|nr:hypothetical protein BLNAU_13719 [Blattamonas nauphoetae]
MNYPYEHGPHQPPQSFGYPMMTPMAPQVMMPMGSPVYPQGFYQNTQILAPPAPLQDPTMSLQHVIHQTGGFVPTFQVSSDKDPIQTATIDPSRVVAEKTFKPKCMKSNQPQSVPDPIDLSQVSNRKPFIPKQGTQLPATDKSKDISLEHLIDSTAPTIFKRRSQTSPTKIENQPTPQIFAPSQPKQLLVPQNDQVIDPSNSENEDDSETIEDQNERFNRAVLEIYDKAVHETEYVQLYADLCKQLVDYEQQLPHSSPPDSPSLRMSVVPTTFRKCLVDKVTTTLKQYAAKSVQDSNSSLRQLQTPSSGIISAPNPSVSPTNERASPSPTPALTTTPTRTSGNSADLERLERRGNVLFVGYLIANDLISTSEAAPCLAALWEGTTPQNVIEENVESVSTFLIVTGKRIQKEAPEAIEKNMNKLTHLIKHGNITPQCKYKLMEAVYARDRNWER